VCARAVSLRAVSVLALVCACACCACAFCACVPAVSHALRRYAHTDMNLSDRVREFMKKLNLS
jgi:hypothetical protein